MVSASAFEEERAEALSGGATEFLRRPFRGEELLETLGRTLGLHYAYGEEEADAEAETSPPLEAPAVAELPPALRSRIRMAATRADLATLLLLAGEVEPWGSDLALWLRDAAQRFAYEKILEVVCRARGGEDDCPQA